MAQKYKKTKKMNVYFLGFVIKTEMALKRVPV